MAGKGNEGPVDRVTFLEIDRSGGGRNHFQPTDPRANAPASGVRIGNHGVFVAEQDMPRLRPDQVAQACDSVVRGEDCYTSLVYLSRARTEDIEALFEASQSPEIRIRWERLWVLSPFFAKLSRLSEGREAIINCMRDDLASVHLLSKFAEQQNQAVQRLFKRLYDPLLNLLLSRLAEYRDDGRRAELLAGILATIETDGDALREALVKAVGERELDPLMPLLFIRYKDPRLNKLSSGLLREKLEQWGGE